MDNNVNLLLTMDEVNVALEVLDRERAVVQGTVAWYSDRKRAVVEGRSHIYGRGWDARVNSASFNAGWTVAQDRLATLDGMIGYLNDMLEDALYWADRAEEIESGYNEGI